MFAWNRGGGGVQRDIWCERLKCVGMLTQLKMVKFIRRDL